MSLKLMYKFDLDTLPNGKIDFYVECLLLKRSSINSQTENDITDVELFQYTYSTVS